MHHADAGPGGTAAAEPWAELRLLGPLEVIGPGGALKLSGARQRAVLGLLALRAPEVLSRAHLIDALWGTEPPPTAVKTLHSHVARVRRALADNGLGELLVTREPGYALRLLPGWLDVGRFEDHVHAGRRALRTGDAACAAAELRAGLALWRGDPLADCPVAEWGQAEIARLQDARLGAAQVLAEADLMRGEHAAVVGELERLVVRHPLRERFWELLVIAHYRCGRQGDALQAYRRARAVLVEELGVEPGPGLRRLEAAVLAGAAELDPSTAPVTTTPPPPDRGHAEPDAGPPGGTPGALTNLVGRQRELSEVLALLTRARLVTLTGPGGCGKTRLALSAADVLAAERKVELVDLTPVRSSELVPDAVSTALGVPERPGADRVDTLTEALAGRELVVVLDNCEHLVQACAELVGRLLGACPALSILATSREALRIAGETAYEIPPLAVPDPEAPRTLSELAAYDSVRLFLDRSAGNGAHAFGDDDAMPIAQLCAALDGLPLAIELAAARSSVLSPAQIVRRLRNRFGLLSVGARDAPLRHRALRATVAWSHDLLTPEEAALFARLGVFAGGFSVEAAEAVGQPDRTLDALSGLVAKSLVRVRRRGSATRFFMLETIAAYATEQLRADPAVAEQARERHAQFFLAQAEEAILDTTGARFDELRVEHDNLRESMSWFAKGPDGTDELRLAAALGRYCHLHGHYREGRQWLDRALARAGNAAPESRIKALAGAASLALFECDYRQAHAHATEGLRLARTHGIDPAQIGRLQRLLGSVARERADYTEALSYYRASRESFLESGDPAGVARSQQLAGATAWLAGDLDTATVELTTSLTRLRELDDTQGAASSLAYLGAVALYRGDTEAAHRLLDEALDIFGELQFKEGIAWALNLLGLVLHDAGQHDKAAPLLQTSLALHNELGDRWRQASVLEALAGVACATGEPDRAAWLLNQAEEIRTAIEAPVPLIERRALTATYEVVGTGRPMP